MKNTCLILTFLLASASLTAQLENVIVEKYYISDSADARNIEYITDKSGNITDSVVLEEGSTTYRIYVQLTAGYMLTKVFSDENHALKISSTADFFNNSDLGVSFGKDLISSRLSYNTEALDSWLTLGQASRTYSGILKSEDKDGSVIGGTKNKSGMLANDDPEAGIPLTSADGLMPILSTPLVWLQSGIVNSSGDDSTIFGSLKPGKQFISHNAFLQCSGVMGTDPTSNKVLIAQLTTRGEISFALNIQVKKADGGSIVNYVANKAPLDDGQGYILSPFLSYPQASSCGCKDPNFLEYNSNLGCSNADSCKTKIICGCMDPEACNFDPAANYSIPSLCCFPGLCGDRDIAIVCPNLDDKSKSGFLLYPNPVTDAVNLEVTSDNFNKARLEIYDSRGRLIWHNNMGVIDGTIITSFNMADLENGLYLARFYDGDKIETKTFIKK